MSFRKLSIGVVGSLLSLLSLWVTSAWACTGLELKAKDGSFINGRTVEFGTKLDLAGLVVPRNYQFKGTLPNGETGLVYQAKYAAIGANTFGTPAIIDGVNEKGLAAGAFYFPGYASYTTVTPQNSKQAIAPTEFVNWALTQFATVDELKQGIKSIVIVPTSLANWGGIAPFHYIVYDTTGKSVVIEPLNGQLIVFDNPIGVITNSPTFDWHLTNLSNYLNLSPNNAPSKQIDGLQLKQLGQGSGLHGLPGDFTPPSRFVRAAFFAGTAIPVDTADQAVLQVFHLLNQFDIPVGSVRSQEANTIVSDQTIATSVKDTKNSKYYIKTYEDQTVKMINLNTFDLNAHHLKTIDIKSIQPIIDVSIKAKELTLATSR